MPSDVQRCEPHQAGTLGTWAPTVDDIVNAASALPSEVCLKPAQRSDAIRACAVKAGSAIVEISTDDLNGPTGCEVHVGAAESAGRRWVVFFGFFRSPGARFSGGSVAVELTSTGPAVYLDALGGKHGSLCPTTGGSPVAPADFPSGWQGLPQPVKDFLCKGAT